MMEASLLDVLTWREWLWMAGLDVIIAGLRPIEAGIDDVEEKKLKERDKKPEYSNQFYCHGCHQWMPCKDDFEPYDCVCGKSRWGG